MVIGIDKFKGYIIIYEARILTKQIKEGILHHEKLIFLFSILHI